MPEWTKPSSNTFPAVLRSLQEAKLHASILTTDGGDPSIGRVLAVGQETVQIARDEESVPTYIALAHIVSVTPKSYSDDPIVVLGTAAPASPRSSIAGPGARRIR
ncbi:hypothetical protein LQ384_09930 [Rhodococcus rhodochrous]|uniref:Uncharacterized protein n=1 Tax=Rhodococcus rhodochrous TaxID=1829 RepID=A0AAW4XF25_RHORH|nr:hypothetical protein [Rhodococcus rhodochrous]MCD2111414.1 hypothetical protein [Rhodococcus rhodochrous]